MTAVSCLGLETVSDIAAALEKKNTLARSTAAGPVCSSLWDEQTNSQWW